MRAGGQFERMNSLNQAQNEFNQARTKAAWERLFGLLTGKNYDLVDYTEVRKRLSNVYNITVSKEIPISSIVGTVSRNQDFTRTFLPKLVQDESRWVNVKMANESQQGVPPIDVYQIGEIYFVLDGHHRVSVMKSINAEYIQANVRIINTEVPLKPTDSPDEIIVKTERQSFLDRTRINELIPAHQIDLVLAGQYPQLYDHIQAHKYFMGIDFKRDISDDEAVVHWYDEVYLPIARTIRQLRLLDQFSGKTETELYLWLENNKAALSEEYGGSVRNTALAWKLDDDFGKGKKGWLYRFARQIFMFFTSDLSDWGVKTGDWRKEILSGAEDYIERVMIAVSNLEEDQAFLESALHFSKIYDAWTGVVHVVANRKELESPKIEAYRETVDRILAASNVRGKFFVLCGKLIRILSERAFWSDMSFFKMHYRPDMDSHNWNDVITNLPGLICIVPERLPRNVYQIVLAFSTSSKAREAMYFAEAMAKVSNAGITVVISGKSVQKRDQALSEANRFFADKPLRVNYINSGGLPGETVLKAAEDVSADLILMGGYSNPFIRRLFQSSTVEAILSKTTVPVIICK